jgi:hypothetical protein
MKQRLKGYADIGKLPEAEQICLIGERALAGQKVGFIVPAGGEQGERYTRELTRLYPSVEVKLIGPLTAAVTAYSAELKPGRD